MKPLIGIIDWATSPQGEPECRVERAVIGQAAEVRRFLCQSDAEFTDKVCGARALIVWHNTPVTASILVNSAASFVFKSVDAAVEDWHPRQHDLPRLHLHLGLHQFLKGPGSGH